MTGPSPVLALDADAYFQLLITSNTELLRRLKSEHGVDSLVVPEVFAEVLGLKSGEAKRDATRAESQGVVKTLDYSDLSVALPVGFFSSRSLAQAAASQVLSLGRRLNLSVDTGEAYSYATAITLNLALVSHDLKAIRALERAKVALPTVIRFFDLVCFAYARGWLSSSQCNGTCRALRKRASEWVPKAFANQSFEAGLPEFDRRLFCSDEGSPSASGTSYLAPLILPPPAT